MNNRIYSRPSDETIQKAQIGLAQWRADKEYAERKGGKFLQAWLDEQEEKRKARESTSRATAIRNFCNDCVGGVMADVTNCTATHCALYPFRPYQK